MDVQTRRDISGTVEIKIELKLLLSANRKSYMPCRLAQQMTLSDLERPFHASRAICAVAELLVKSVRDYVNLYSACN